MEKKELAKINEKLKEKGDKTQRKRDLTIIFQS